MGISKLNAEGWLAKLLLEEVRKEIDGELIKALKDPNYKPDLTPMIFESEEDKQKYEEHFKKVWDSRNDFLKEE
tara:strand:- start:62201 stop:62422 length:222 start_codon:yes stop_codon:yes gene_type:complete